MLGGVPPPAPTTAYSTTSTFSEKVEPKRCSLLLRKENQKAQIFGTPRPKNLVAPCEIVTQIQEKQIQSYAPSS
jgi:hypothetical protein